MGHCPTKHTDPKATAHDSCHSHTNEYGHCHSVREHSYKDRNKCSCFSYNLSPICACVCLKRASIHLQTLTREDLLHIQIISFSHMCGVIILQAVISLGFHWKAFQRCYILAVKSTALTDVLPSGPHT